MYIQTSIQGSTARLSLIGHFTFDSRLKFKSATNSVVDNPALIQLDIDLSAVDYMDSAGLGMLLLLKERMGERRTIRLLNPKGAVASVLDITHFEKIFTIEPPLNI